MSDDHLHNPDTAYKHKLQYVLKHFNTAWQQKVPDSQFGDYVLVVTL